MIDARLKLVVAAGLMLCAVAIAVTLLQSPTTVASVNTARETLVETIRKPTSICQSGETLPQQTSAIRLRLYAFLGPRIRVEALAPGKVLARGERSSGWTGGVVTVPVRKLAKTQSGVELCFTVYVGNEPVGLVGEQSTGSLVARTPYGVLPGRVRIEYMRPGRRSWWSLAPEVARRMGLGHAPSGTWIVLLALALVASLIALSTRLILRELG